MWILFPFVTQITLWRLIVLHHPVHVKLTTFTILLTVTILLTACRGWDSKTWNNLAVSLTRALFWYKSHSYSVNIRYCEFDIVLEILMSKYNKGLDGKGGYCFLLIHVHARGCKLLLVLIIVIAWQISAYTFCQKM